MKNLTITILLLLTFIACNDTQNQRIVHSDNNDITNSITNDNIQLNSNVENKLIVGLPQKLDSSNCVIFPLYMIEINNSRKEASKISYSSRGYLIPLENLLFQNINTSKTHYLTNEKIKILSYEQLYSTNRVAEKFIIYEIINTDTNKDGFLNMNDITNLYISDSNGKNLSQLNHPKHHLLEWNYISEVGKVFFSTSEDIDKNGDFDNNDKQQLYSVSIKDFSKIEVLFAEIN